RRRCAVLAQQRRVREDRTPHRAAAATLAGQLHVVLHIADAHRDVDVLVRQDLQVRTRADLLSPVVALGTLRVLEIEADVVSERVRTTRHARAVLLRATRTEDRPARIRLTLRDVQLLRSEE